MRKNTFLLILIFFAQQINAQTYYNQLYEFNPNWEKHENQISTSRTKKIKSDAEYVQTHLNEVLPILKLNSASALNYQQKLNRSRMIKSLEAYAQAGLFPVNNYREERIPVFIDEYNTHCAVGHLLKQSGFESLALRIAEDNNYAWVKEINDPELLVWQEHSGFTLEELKLIQGAYDFYPILDVHDPNKYEIPQKPEFMTLYFDDKKGGSPEKKSVWCMGEGKNGVLHGRWEQNYSETLPWIVGYFNKGKRTGQWKEYYQGTDKLCRTENWRNNKLNGVRKRFNKNGEIIEEILFRNGKAVTKTNYDLEQSLMFIRKPLDSNIVWTDVYTLGGSILASGKERVHNPGNLMWFQNIELTALNTAAITSRDLQNQSNLRGGSKDVYMNPESGTGLYNAPPLVEYKKEGEWLYYKDYSSEKSGYTESAFHNSIYRNYPTLEVNMRQLYPYLKDQKIVESFDSIVVNYTDDHINDFVGYSEKDFLHLSLQYHPEVIPLFDFDYLYHEYGQIQGSQHINSVSLSRIKVIGEYNENDKRIGTWKYYDLHRQLYKTENYIIPWGEDLTQTLTAR